MSPRVRALMADYAQWHTTRGNLACHALGVPLIVVALAGLLHRLVLFDIAGLEVTAAEGLAVAAAAGYLVQGRLGVATAVGVLVLVAAGRNLAVVPAVAAFVAGWLFQFVGHYAFEGKPPAFTRNASHILIAPLWLVAKLTRVQPA